ncbi:hypothetical protein ACQEU3_37720 [Spirillospora sp. CA-253888]
MRRKTMLRKTTAALAAAAALTGAAAVPAHARDIHELVGMYANRERCVAAGQAGEAAGKWAKAKWYCFSIDWASERQGLYIIREGSAKPRPAR